ncbi:hypothetical protein LX36DRAFT_249290 [Colletotrichum falcatum]|nr:hypothetical protein LX36DRAFT_249290 [Colletotrichum falcatum]
MGRVTKKSGIRAGKRTDCAYRLWIWCLFFLLLACTNLHSWFSLDWFSLLMTRFLAVLGTLSESAKDISAMLFILITIPLSLSEQGNGSDGLLHYTVYCSQLFAFSYCTRDLGLQGQNGLLVLVRRAGLDSGFDKQKIPRGFSPRL